MPDDGVFEDFGPPGPDTTSQTAPSTAAPTDGVFEDFAPPPAGATRRRRKARMGAVMSSMGTKARARPQSADVGKIVEQRERQQKADRLLNGGVSKGERKGYGAASGRKEPPLLTEQEMPDG